MREPVLPEAPPPARSPNTTQWTHRTDGATARSVRGALFPLLVDPLHMYKLYKLTFVRGEKGLTATAPLNGLLAATLSVAAVGEQAAVINRGFWQEGLALHPKEYEGHVFARTKAKLSLVVALEEQRSSGKPNVLAQTSLELDGTGQWQRLNFTLTPATPTACSSAPFGTAPMYCEPGLASRVALGASCLRCSGQLSFTLNSVGSVDLDMAFLQEGSSWGTLPNGIPAKRETVEWMTRMGIRSIRTGGKRTSA